MIINYYLINNRYLWYKFVIVSETRLSKNKGLPIVRLLGADFLTQKSIGMSEFRIGIPFFLIWQYSVNNRVTFTNQMHILKSDLKRDCNFQFKSQLNTKFPVLKHILINIYSCVETHILINIKFHVLKLIYQFCKSNCD